jgi:hypothetical protein
MPEVSITSVGGFPLAPGSISRQQPSSFVKQNASSKADGVGWRASSLANIFGKWFINSEGLVNRYLKYNLFAAQQKGGLPGISVLQVSWVWCKALVNKCQYLSTPAARVTNPCC